MPRFRTDDREKSLSETRRKLLEAAVLEFSNKGFEPANINTISEGAGLGKGTVYNYFASKRDLMLAAIHEVSAGHHEYIRSRVLTEGEALARLKAFYAAGFDFVSEFPSQARFMISTMYSSNQEFKQAIYAEYRWMAHMIHHEILEYGKQQGLFEALNPAVITGLLMTVYLGSVAVVDENSRPYMCAEDVYDFVLRSVQ